MFSLYQPSKRPAAVHFPRPPQQADGAWFAHRRNAGRAWGLLRPGWPRQLKTVAVLTQLFWGLGVSQLYTWRLCVCTGCKHQSSLRGSWPPRGKWHWGELSLPGSGVALYPWHCLLCRPQHGSNSTRFVKAKMRQCHKRRVCTMPVSLQLAAAACSGPAPPRQPRAGPALTAQLSPGILTAQQGASS